MSAVSSQAVAITVDQLFSAAFSASRDPRSGEYMDGARAALAYRIEGARIGQPYQVGTAAADAFASGIAKGHAIWRGASGQPVTTDGAYVDGLRIIGQLAADIEAQVGDIEILLAALFDKLDALTDLAPATVDAVAAINCFATCALRNAVLIGEGQANIAALVAEGGAARAPVNHTTQHQPTPARHPSSCGPPAAPLKGSCITLAGPGRYRRPYAVRCGWPTWH